MAAPTEMLQRSVPFSAFETRDDAGDGLTLEGYGAVTNSDAVIDSWEGNFIERFAPGSWKRTLRANKPVMQFDHGRDARVGATPIGAFEKLAEDETGLFVRARLHDNEQVKPVRDAIASGAISGMSVRFSVVRERWQQPAKPEDGLPVRTILEARLFEVGPVVFPAYHDTAVGVRSSPAVLVGDPEWRAALVAELAASGEFLAELDRARNDGAVPEPAGPPLDLEGEGSAGTSGDEPVGTSDSDLAGTSEPIRQATRRPLTADERAAQRARVRARVA